MRTRLPLYPLHLAPEGDPSGPGTATVVPAPETPPNTRNDSHPGKAGLHPDAPLTTALREFREAAQRGEIVLEGQEPLQTPAAPPGSQPAAAAPPTPPAVEGGEAPPTADPATADLAAAVAGDPAGTEPPPGDEPALEADDPLLNIELPPRRGQEPVTIRVEDRESAEALRHMRNLATRTEHAEARVQDLRAAQDELDAFDYQLRMDPVGTIVENLAPQRHAELARHLLTLPGVLEQLAPDLEAWGEPTARELATERLKNQRLERRGQVHDAIGARAQQRDITNTIVTAVERIAEIVAPELAQQFRDDAIGDMSAHVRGGRVTGKPAPDQFPRLLAQRLRLYGIKPEAALAALSDATSTPHPSSQPRPKGPAATALAAKPAAQGAKATGQHYVQASRVRQLAAAGLPQPGAALTTATGERPPKGSGVKGTIKWLQDKLAPAAPR